MNKWGFQQKIQSHFVLVEVDDETRRCLIFIVLRKSQSMAGVRGELSSL